MEIVVQILLVFIGAGCIIKVSFNRWWYPVIVGVVAAAFVAAAYPLAIRQSKTEIADYLQNITMMQNIAVLITVEASVMLAYIILRLKQLSGDGMRPWILAMLQWFPGVLIFPVLFFILTTTIFSFPGVGFSTIAYGLALVVAVLVPALAWLMRRLVPEEELRLEVLLLVVLFVVILGLICTVDGSTPYKAAEQPLNVQALVFSAAVFLLLFAAGMLTNRLRWKLRK